MLIKLGGDPEGSAAARTPAWGGDGEVRDGVWVPDITGVLIQVRWPTGMRVIVRKERLHPGADTFPGPPLHLARGRTGRAHGAPPLCLEP
jgi:hypothetical protein